mgnify:FL=1
MVIYGGQVKRSSTKPCHGSSVYVYNLVCHRWISLSDMYTSLQVAGR